MFFLPVFPEEGGGEGKDKVFWWKKTIQIWLLGKDFWKESIPMGSSLNRVLRFKFSDFCFSNSRSFTPAVTQHYSSADKKQKIQSFVSNQLNLLETELLAVTKQERLQNQELGKEVDVEVVTVKNTKYRGAILQLKQRNDPKGRVQSKKKGWKFPLF